MQGAIIVHNEKYADAQALTIIDSKNSEIYFCDLFILRFSQYFYNQSMIIKQHEFLNKIFYNYKNIFYLKQAFVNIMENQTLAQINVQVVKTKPYAGQKPGTSGLRKKVVDFQQENYVENFIQAYFNALRRDALSPKNSLLIGGDGRYLTKEVISTICKIACANGVDELHIAKDGLMSTPACSAYIRQLNQKYGNSLGGIILTASHNPGGPHEDFGIKFNSRNGGPALQEFTNSVHLETTRISEYKTVDFEFLKVVDINTVNQYVFENVNRPRKSTFTVKVVENVKDYVELMRRQFNFEIIKNFLQRKDFKMVFDAMYGAAGPYAKAIFQDQFQSDVKLLNCDPKPDFGGHHPDPNLVCAHQLVQLLGVFHRDTPSQFQFGAACDGDADRNMIIGKNFFVTPSDSLAVLAAHSQLFMKKKLTGVARSMPTSGAIDKVAKQMNLRCYQTPTGWKFFGNLMEEDLIGLCGEQSFGTGSSHVRQKDGLWTVLAWLQILASLNVNSTGGKFIGVEDVLKQFWSKYGRNYYKRFDYENIPDEIGNKVWSQIEGQIKNHSQKYVQKGITPKVFDYVDPVDGSLSKDQGLMFNYANGSRVIFRKSGTGSSGITLRVYFQKYEQKTIDLQTSQALKELISLGLQICQIKQIAGLQKPTVQT